MLSNIFNAPSTGESTSFVPYIIAAVAVVLIVLFVILTAKRKK